MFNIADRFKNLKMLVTTCTIARIMADCLFEAVLAFIFRRENCGMEVFCNLLIEVHYAKLKLFYPPAFNKYMFLQNPC